MKKFLLASIMSLAMLLPGSRESESEVCYHGCSSINLSVFDYVHISLPFEEGCTPSCGQEGVAYRIQLMTSCGSGEQGLPGTYCTDEVIPTGNYQVNAIGSGCSGQGCVRLCPCP